MSYHSSKELTAHFLLGNFSIFRAAVLLPGKTGDQRAGSLRRVVTQALPHEAVSFRLVHSSPAPAGDLTPGPAPAVSGFVIVVRAADYLLIE